MNPTATFILILLTPICINTMDWTEMNNSNGVILVKAYSAFLSFSTHTQTHKVTFEEVAAKQMQIHKQMQQIKQKCETSDENSCKTSMEIIDRKMKLLFQKTSEILGSEMNFENLSELRGNAGNEVNDIYMEINRCSMKLNEYERLILSLHNLLLMNDVTNLEKVMNDENWKKTIFEIMLNGDGLKTNAQQKKCKSLEISKQMMLSLMKTIKISSFIETNEVKITIEVPKIGGQSVEIYKVQKIPLEYGDKVYTMDKVSDYISLTCNATTTGIPQNRVETAIRLYKTHLLIQLRGDEVEEHCDGAIIQTESSNFRKIHNCNYYQMYKSTYITKITNDLIHIHTVTPVDVMTTCMNKTSIHVYETSGILRLPPNCKVYIEYFEFFYAGNETTTELIAPKMNESTMKKLNETYSGRGEKHQHAIYIRSNQEFNKIAERTYTKNKINGRIKVNEESQNLMIITISITMLIIATNIMITILAYKKITNVKTQLEMASKLIKHINKVE